MLLQLMQVAPLTHTYYGQLENHTWSVVPRTLWLLKKINRKPVLKFKSTEQKSSSPKNILRRYLENQARQNRAGYHALDVNRKL